MSDAVSQFLKEHEAVPVGMTPTLPVMPPEEDGAKDESPRVDLTVEVKDEVWAAKPVSEAPAKDGEFPVRFIDGCQAGQPVFCLSVRGKGYPVPLLLAEVGAVELKSEGRRFVRGFQLVERVLSFVAHDFPWEQVEAFSQELANDPSMRLKVLPANRPTEAHSPFDYEVMRTQARARAQQEMTTLERLALAVNPDVPTLVDGPLNRVTGTPMGDGPLLVGVVKMQAASYLHDAGWRTLLTLRPGQRTPVFKIAGVGGTSESNLPVATWYLKLAGGPRLAPNWGYVRVEVPWVQFVDRGSDFGFVDRLSRWLIDARCRSDSYTRMPVSLEPIVRAEEALKPLFTPLPVLVNRLYRRAGLFHRNGA